jgi:hypothetical protein
MYVRLSLGKDTAYRALCEQADTLSKLECVLSVRTESLLINIFKLYKHEHKA